MGTGQDVVVRSTYPISVLYQPHAAPETAKHDDRGYSLDAVVDADCTFESQEAEQECCKREETD
jgi:hypothetical protein